MLAFGVRASTRRWTLAATLVGATAAAASAEPDFSGVWGMVQHDRLGAPFFIPVEPKLNDAGKAVTAAFGNRSTQRSHAWRRWR